MSKNKNLPVITLSASGDAHWCGGAYTLTFVYSNRGNFLIKGYLKETEEYLKNEVHKGLKYFCNYTLYHTYSKNSSWDKGFRNIWHHYSPYVHLFSPDPENGDFLLKKS